MANLNLTLDNFTIPGLGNYTPEFGTKLEIGKGMSTAQMNSNIMMPFMAQRPVHIIENSTTTKIEADRRLVFDNSGLTVTLGLASFAGCRVQVSSSFSSGTSYVRYAKGEGFEVQSVTKGTVITLVSGADGNFSLCERIYNGKVMNATYEPKGGINVAHNRWCTFAFNAENRQSIKIKADTHIPLDIMTAGAKERRWLDVEDDTIIDLSTSIVAAANATDTNTGIVKGRNFYVYLVPKDEGVGIVVSCNSTYPNDIDADYTANNTRKIAWFSTMCADVGENLAGIIPAAPGTVSIGTTYLVMPYDNSDTDFYTFYNKEVLNVTAGTYYDVLLVKHPLAGFKAGDIVPESVWCLSFKPFGIGGAMVYSVMTDSAIDVYKQSGTGLNTASEYGGTVVSTRQWQNHQNDFLQVRKTLLSDNEFTAAAIGGNERTIAAADDADTYKVLHAGGHVDTLGNAMISFIGAWETNGAGWEWINTPCANGGSGFTTYDGQGSFGQMYGASYSLLAGGTRDNVTSCGSRCRHAALPLSSASASLSGRGASRVVCGA